MNTRTLIAVGLALLVLAGCTRWLPALQRDIAPRYAGADDHLLFAERLADADERELAVIDQRLAEATRGDGDSADRRLRRALWLARPGHDGHDRQAALALLSEFEDGAGDLTPASRALARIMRRHLEVTARLAGERDELRARVRALTSIEGDLEEVPDEVTDEVPEEEPDTQ